MIMYHLFLELTITIGTQQGKEKKMYVDPQTLISEIVYMHFIVYVISYYAISAYFKISLSLWKV